MFRFRDWFGIIGRIGTAAIFVAMGVSSFSARAADPVAGKALYNAIPGAPLSCAFSGCHGTDPSAGPNNGTNNIRLGANNASVIQSAIDTNKGNMGFLKLLVSTTDLQNIAAYIANPSAGTPAPAIQLSTNTLGFGNQTVPTASSPMVVTVTNSGSANLILSTISASGSNATEFGLSGSCAAGATIAPSANCTISVVFTPQGLTARSASIAIAHNATGSPSTVALSGTGVAAPAAALGLSANSVAFGDQLIGATSVAKSITVSNTGTAALTLNSLSVVGANASDFQLAGSCTVGANMVPASSCTLNVTFKPGATGSRAAPISIASSVAGSPHSVSLTGTGVAAGVPAVSLAPTSISFGNLVIGVAGSPQPVTLTNSGSATLGISNISVTGPGFAHSSSCGASLAPAATCTINIVFTPIAAGAATGNLTVATNASGSPHAIPLAGTGVSQPAALTSTRFKGDELEFKAQRLNTSSAPRSVVLMNTGDQPLGISSLKITGVNAGDFALVSNCPIGGVLGAKANCTITVIFTPTLTGSRKAQITLISNAKGQPTVQIKGVGVARPGETRDDHHDKDDR
jgi:Abnormal spindle-like microcephaly-assoc'd, ASPM-SPD-2-Hydin